MDTCTVVNPVDFKGGSLNKVIGLDDKVIKRYTGEITRGSNKLREEHSWIKALPESLTSRYPLCFPDVLEFVDNPTSKLTELHLARVPRNSITKSILCQELKENRATEYIDLSLSFLVDDLFPIRMAESHSFEIYNKFHSGRLALARKYLRRLPYLAKLLNAGSTRVNGVLCPSINQFLIWLDANAKSIYKGRILKAIHGNFHLDNILIDVNEEPSKSSLTFIDPRGDLVGPPTYDFAKILITLEAYYDEIHYGGYDIKYKYSGKCYDISISIDSTNTKVYRSCLESLNNRLNDFASIAGLETDDFLWSVYTTECIHILSFCFYHAYGPHADPNRIRSFIAIFAILAKRLFEMWDQRKPYSLPEDRLTLLEK